jgi:hypothetical protein
VIGARVRLARLPWKRRREHEQETADRLARLERMLGAVLTGLGSAYEDAGREVPEGAAAEFLTQEQPPVIGLVDGSGIRRSAGRRRRSA